MIFDIKPQDIKTVLDLGTHQIKLTQLDEVDGEGVIHLADYRITPSTTDFAVSTYIEGPIIDPLAVELQLKNCFEGMGLSYPPVIALLPDHCALTSMVTASSESDVEAMVDAVREEFAPILQVPVESWNFHHFQTGMDEGEKLLFGIALLRENLLEIGGIIQRSGLNPQVMDVSTLNLLNLLEGYLKARENSGKNIAVVNMGNETTSIAVFQDSDLKVFSNKSIGGYDFSRQVSEHFHVTEKDADEFKKNESFFLDEFVAEQDDLYNYNVIRGIFGELVKEIFGTLEQFLIKSREFTVNEVIIAGGGANFKNIHVVLEGNLNTRVFPVAEIIQVKKNSVELTPEEKNILAPCLGGYFRY